MGEAPTSWTTVNERHLAPARSPISARSTWSKVRSALASSTPPVDLAGPTFSPDEPEPLQEGVHGAGGGERRRASRRRASTAACSPRPRIRAFAPAFRSAWGRAARRRSATPILTATTSQELIVPTEDGTIHAYEPDGSELAGWPVHTQDPARPRATTRRPGSTRWRPAARPPREPLRGPVVADLNGDGVPEVIDSAGIHVYAFEPDGIRACRASRSPRNLSFCGPAQREPAARAIPSAAFSRARRSATSRASTSPSTSSSPRSTATSTPSTTKGNPLPGFPVAARRPGEAAPTSG